MPGRFTTEQIQQLRDGITKAFEEALTDEEVAALGHPNPIKCLACKVGLYAAAGVELAAALAMGIATLEEDPEVIELLVEYFHVSKLIIETWLQEASEDDITSVKSLVHFLCKKSHACK